MQRQVMYRCMKCTNVHIHTCAGLPPAVPACPNYSIVHKHNVTKEQNRQKFSPHFSSSSAQSKQLFPREPFRIIQESSKVKQDCMLNSTKHLLGLSQVRGGTVKQ